MPHLIVWIRPRGDRRGVFLAATAQDQLFAEDRLVHLPVDGSPIQLVLQKCERSPVQVVSTDGKPVPDVVISSCGLGDESRNREPVFALFCARSDSGGMTRPLLHSKDKQFHVLSPNIRFVSVETSSKPIRIVVAPTQPKVEVRGKLEIPSGIGEGLLLRGTSRNNTSNESSYFVCRIQPDGSFVVEVPPEESCAAHVSNSTWVSSTWSGIMASNKPDVATSVSLDIFKGAPVEVFVTQGKDLKPAKGIWVEFITYGGRRWAASTDDEGFIAMRANPGKLKVIASQDDWREDLTTTVLPGGTTVVKFHRTEFETVAFTGQVSIAGVEASNVAMSDIILDLHCVKKYPPEPIELGDDGRYQASATKPHIALGARTKDRKYMSAQSFNLEVNKGAMVLELRPSISVFGRILDPDGFPLPETTIIVEARPKAAWPAKNRWDSCVTDYVGANTDSQGRYSLSGVCSGVPLEMTTRYRDRRDYPTTVFEDHVFEQQIALMPTVIMPESDMNSRPLQIRLENRINSSRLLNSNVVLVYHGTDASATSMAEGLFVSDESKAAVNLSPLLFSDEDLKAYPANAAWLKEQGLELSSEHELMLVLFDQKGKPIFRKRVLESETINSISEIIGPKQMVLVEKKWDAKARFEMALELAQRTDRDVWSSFVSLRNPASIALLRWQEDNREELEKHFVLLQIDWIRDENVDFMTDRFNIPTNEEKNLICVLVNKVGLLLQETTGASLYRQMQSSQFLDRVRIGALLNATSRPIDPAKTQLWLDSM